jgi:diguanylate cyclase (GGDEF)-like protein
VDESTGRLLAANGAFARLVGLPPSVAVGRTAVELGLYDGQTEDRLRMALADWGALHGEPVPVWAADGTARLLHYFAVRQMLGNRTVLLCQFEDVTVVEGLLRALKALPTVATQGDAEFEGTLLRALADALAVPTAFVVHFGDGKAHRALARAALPDGLSTEVELTADPRAFLPGERGMLIPPALLCDAFADQQGQAAEPETLALVAVRGIDGVMRGVLGVQLGQPWPDPSVVEAVLPVYADRVAAERARVRAVLRGQSAIDQDVLGVAACDAEGRMVEVNAMLHQTPHQLAGRTLMALCHAEDRAPLHEVLSWMQRGEPDPPALELRLSRGPDEWINVQVRWRAHRPRAHRDRPDTPHTSMAPAHHLAIVQDITDRKRAEAQIYRLAWSDPVTRLPNRSLFLDRLEAALARTRRTGEVFAVHFLDLDHFKNVNDTLGHPIGDRLLGAVALRLQATVREMDTVARMGGDEFAVLQAAVEGPAQAGRLAERLIGALAEPFNVGGHVVHTSASVGVACAGNAADAVNLMEQADMALYRAKAQGRGRYAFHTPALGEAVRARIALGDDLRVALRSRDGAFGVAYQPIVDLSSGALVGLEALARWDHPARGLVPPPEFVGVAEDRGLMAELTRRVLGEAAHAVAAWNVGRSVPLRLCINLSPLDLRRPTFVEEVTCLLAESGLRPVELVCEVTEAALAEEMEAVVGRMAVLRKTGVAFWLDDFGTGASSLKVLRHLPLQGLKVAQDFVKTMLDVDGDVETVRATVSIGRSLGWTVVAEGVERAEQATALRNLGCTLAQGNHICAPMSSLELGARYRLRDSTPPSIRRVG